MESTDQKVAELREEWSSDECVHPQVAYPSAGNAISGDRETHQRAEVWAADQCRQIVVTEIPVFNAQVGQRVEVGRCCDPITSTRYGPDVDFPEWGLFAPCPTIPGEGVRSRGYHFYKASPECCAVDATFH